MAVIMVLQGICTIDPSLVSAITDSLEELPTKVFVRNLIPFFVRCSIVEKDASGDNVGNTLSPASISTTLGFPIR